MDIQVSHFSFELLINQSKNLNKFFFPTFSKFLHAFMLVKLIDFSFQWGFIAQ